MNKLDQLDAAERAMSHDQTKYWDGMALIRNHARALIDVARAAQCIKHWHDTANGGMIVSGRHVVALWDALARLEAE